MNKDELSERFFNFSLRIIKLVDALPNTIAGNAIARQLIRSGTSPSANYRAACLAKSNKDFVNKLKMVEEEIDETAHWIRLIMESEMINQQRIQQLYNECLELCRIIYKSIATTKKNLQHDKL